MWIVHAGHRVDAPGESHQRLPEERIPALREFVGRVFDALEPDGVVSAAAAGGDLVVLSAAIERRIPICVILPLEREDFVMRSVADRDLGWTAEFEAVAAHAIADESSVFEAVDLSGEEAWYLSGNHLLLERARGCGSGPIVALAITSPDGDGSSATDHFADAAEAAGLVVIALDTHSGRLRVADRRSSPGDD